MARRGCFRFCPALPAIALLGACGGSDGPLSTPPPSVGTPSTPPSPTPTPTPVAILPFATSASFETIVAERVEVYNGGSDYDISSISVSGRGPSITFSYDAGDQRYIVEQGGKRTTFDVASGTFSGGLLNFASQDGNIKNELSLLRNVNTTSYPGVTLSHVSFGKWSYLNTDTSGSHMNYFVFGSPTETNDIPKTGSANYRVAVSGNVRDTRPTATSPKEYSIDGTATFSADFAAGTVDTVLTLAGRLTGQYFGTGPIVLNQFSGQLESTNRYFQGGAFMGGFFGPDASEVGYSFYIYNHNPDPYAGASVNHVNQWVVGAVVGAIDD